jgi:uncharacterized cupredoxin-like copper-binding protein
MMINASVVLGLFVLPALAPAPMTVAGRSDPVVRVVATDYRLALPTSLPAGPTTFRLVNQGRELHQLYLVRLAEGGKSAADLVKAMKAGGPPPSWAIDVGGPNGVDPGGTAPDVTVRLTPGHYAALCIIPSADGVLHVMKGMYADVTVTPAPEQASLPMPPDVTLTFQDYGYATSGPLTRGYHRLLVHNDGKQSHELELARLAPGKSPADIPAWIESMKGPPPASFLGGVGPLAPGQENELSLTLTPGRYVMLCFIPDAKDGKPHTAHGMMHDFVVN